MKSFFRELFEYNHYCNQALIAAFRENPGKVPDKSTRLLNHMLNAHHNWNNRIIPEQSRFDPWAIHAAESWEAIGKANFEASIRVIDSVDLDQSIQFTIANEQPFEHAIRNILFHIINHSTYHRGQIALEFSQNGLEPLITDYILYKLKFNK